MKPPILSVLAVAGLLAACGGLLASCGDDNVAAPVIQVQVVTDASQYSRKTGDVRPTLVNASNRTVYLFSCTESTTLEVLESGTWKDLGAWYPTCLEANGTTRAPSRPYPVEAGTFTDLPHLTADDMATLDPGTYRMRVQVYANSEPPYDLLPEDQRVSEPFELVD
jgi:hypothetical protein